MSPWNWLACLSDGFVATAFELFRADAKALLPVAKMGDSLMAFALHDDGSVSRAGRP